jgi:hypothetical protein
MRLILILFLFTVLSCADQRVLDTYDEPGDVLTVSTEYNIPPEEKTAEPQSSIIKTANYRFQVTNVDTSTKNIESIAKQFGASVAEMNLISNSSAISNTFTIRVPSQNFEDLMNALGADAVFTHYKKISTEDVSEEFVDIESRLKTKKEVRDRYIDILKNKAKTVTDVLKAEEQIRILTEEIEAKEGRLKYLKSRVALSTIHLEIYQHVTFQETPDVFEKPYVVEARQGFSNGWSIVVGLSLFFINIWPLLFLGILIYWRRSWIRKKLFSKA